MVNPTSDHPTIEFIIGMFKKYLRHHKIHIWGINKNKKRGINNFMFPALVQYSLFGFDRMVCHRANPSFFRFFFRISNLTQTHLEAPRGVEKINGWISETICRKPWFFTSKNRGFWWVSLHFPISSGSSEIPGEWSTQTTNREASTWRAARYQRLRLSAKCWRGLWPGKGLWEGPLPGVDWEMAYQLWSYNMLQLITCYNSLKHWDIHGYTTNDGLGIPVKWWDPAVVFGSIMVRELDFDIRDLDLMVNSGTFVGQLPKPQKSWALKYQIPSNTIKQKIITYQLNIIKCHGLMTNKYTKDELTSSCWHCSHWTSVLRSARRALSQSCRWEAIPVSLSAPWRLEWLIKDQPAKPMSVSRNGLVGCRMIHQRIWATAMSLYQ